MSQKSACFFQTQSASFGIYQADENQTERAYDCIDGESYRRAEIIHHWQECEPNDEVGSPIGTCADRRTNRTNVQREKLTLHPRYVADSKRISTNIEHNTQKDDDGSDTLRALIFCRSMC